MSEKLLDSDRQLYNDAEDMLNTARATYDFVTIHLSRVYQLKPGDVVNPDGTITRAVTENTGAGDGNGTASQGEARTLKFPDRNKGSVGAAGEVLQQDSGSDQRNEGQN